MDKEMVGVLILGIVLGWLIKIPFLILIIQQEEHIKPLNIQTSEASKEDILAILARY